MLEFLDVLFNGGSVVPKLTALAAYWVYGAVLILSVVQQLSTGPLMDSQKWAPISGQFVMMIVIGQALLGDLDIGNLAVLGVACCGTFSLGVLVGIHGLPSFGGTGAGNKLGVDKKDFFDKLPQKLHLKVKKSGSNESVTESPSGSTTHLASATKVLAKGHSTTSTSTRQGENGGNSDAAAKSVPLSDNGDAGAGGVPVVQGRRERRISMSQLATEVAKEVTSSSPAERSVMDLTTDTARQTLFALIGLPGVSPSMAAKYSTRRWALARSSSTSHIWQSKESKEDGILLRGSSFTKLDSDEVLRWLSDNERLSGIDGICHSIETQFRTVESGTRNKVTVRRLVVKSSSVMRSKRDFVVITCVSTLNDGTHIITSRSFPEDFEAKSVKKKDKGCLRGLVHGSGYILHPWKSSDGTESGCEISYACHLDMKGAGVSNHQKAEPLIEAVLATLRTLREVGTKTHNSDDDSGDFSDVDSETLDEQAVSGDSRQILEARRRAQSQSMSPDLSVGGAESSRRASVLDEPNFDKAEVSDAMSAGSGALRDMKRLHDVYTRGALTSTDAEATATTTASSAGTTDSWEVFHNEDGITVKELSNYGNMGVLSASCTTTAAPHVVKKLLLEHPEAVDSILEGRAVLSRLDPYTHIQYLAYGAIWPIGARDFLLVTTEDVYDYKTNTGFVIASTSIDDLLDLEGVEEAGLSKMYTRSTLKLAGYVGVQNAKGGTDLTLFVDMGVAAYMPAWLLQVLAQYGLSEMMMKIKNAAEGNALPSGQLDIGKVLESVQTSDSRIKSFVKDLGGSAVPFPSSPPQNPRTPRRESLARHSERPNMDEINSLRKTVLHSTEEGGDGGDSGGDEGNGDGEDAAWKDRRSASLTSKTRESQSQQRASTQRQSQSRPSQVQQQQQQRVSIVIPREATPYDHHLPQFAALAREAAELIKMYMGHAPDTRKLGLQWEQKVSQKNVTVYGSPVDHSEWAAIRGLTLARNADIEDIIALLSNDDRTKEYDNMFDKYSFFCEGEDGKFKVRLVQMSGIWPTAPREFVVLSVRDDAPDGSVYLCTRSPTHNEIEPESKGYVRGMIQISGYCLQPYSCFTDANRPTGMNEGDIQITLCAHTELGGSLPTSVVNRLSTGAPVSILTAITSVVNNKKK